MVRIYIVSPDTLRSSLHYLKCSFTLDNQNVTLASAVALIEKLRVKNFILQQQWYLEAPTNRPNKDAEMRAEIIEIFFKSSVVKRLHLQVQQAVFLGSARDEEDGSRDE